MQGECWLVTLKNYSLEFWNCRTSTFWVSTNQVRCNWSHYNRWYPLAGNLTSVDRLTFLSANKECRLLHPKSGCSFKNLSRLIARGFFRLLPSFSFPSLIQLWSGWISYPMEQKRKKNTPKRSPATHAKKSQSITYFNRNCCVQLFKCWMVLSTGWITIKWITQLVSPYLYIHWIMISLVDSTIHLLNNKGLYLCDLKTKTSKWKVIVSGINARQKDTCLMVHPIVTSIWQYLH